MSRLKQRPNNMKTWTIYYHLNKVIKTKEVTAINYDDSGKEFNRITKLPLSSILKRIKYSSQL